MTRPKPQTKASRQRHWYRFFVGECPVCGRDQSYRQRIYSPRPIDPADRVVHLLDVETYDQCMERQ